MTVSEPTGAHAYTQLFDPAVRADPYPLYEKLRAEGPIRLPGTPIVLLTGHADCTALLRDAQASVQNSMPRLRLGLIPPGTPLPPGSARMLAPRQNPSFLFLDPPDHTRLRRLVQKAFTPRVVAGLAPRITRFVDQVLDRATATGGFDAVEDLGYPLPITVICELLGVPLDDQPRLRRLSGALARLLDPVAPTAESLGPDLAEMVTAREELDGYFDRLTVERRANPGPDLLTQLIAAEDAGDKLTHNELIATCGLLLIAGHETTVNLIANTLLALLRHPDLHTALAADPDIAPAVVEESLRHDPPVQLLPRIAAAPMRFGETAVAAGEVVIAVIAAANRDPDVFPDPTRFDLTRDNRHLSFGLGAHFCLGAPLARLEARIAITRFAHRIRAPRLLTDPPRYRPHVNLRGPATLPIEFDANPLVSM
ncbi:cytochrome P450 [Nocardia crassostreae]|uniref:cytochrome P450 n=1 Tax=Nocardia crassostreae TaxID=53428 RepID=UPI00082A1BC0|nr:cytochrome P450 [Nocardia crassostreae]